MKKETLSTIAARVGVSMTTVSRVLKGKSDKYRISKRTAALVTAEAKRCGYSSGAAAQNLRNVKSRTIGVLLPSVANPYFADIASAIIAELNKKGFTAIVVDTMENEERLSEMARDLLTRQVEGIIAVPCGNNPVPLERVSQQIPVVLTDRYYEGSPLPYVTTNNRLGSFDICTLLLNSGHRRIACIQGASDSMPNLERIKGYREAMDSFDNGENCIIVGNEFSVLNGYLETKLLLSGPSRPDAIFALSNTIMLGSLKAIREAGLTIPGDIAIASFDNNLYMDYLTPAITRVSQPTDDMSKLTVKILLDRINGTAQGSSQIKLSPTIIFGKSI